MSVTGASGPAIHRCAMAVLLVGAVLTLLPVPSPAISLEQKEPAVPPPANLPVPVPPVTSPSQEEIDVRSLSAQGVLRKGLWNRAMAESAAILAGGSPDLQAVGVLAVAAAVLGDERAVNTALPKLQESGGDKYYATLTQGILDLKGKATDKADKAFAAILNAHPNDPLALYFHGEVLNLRGKRQEALTTFKAVIQQTPDFAPALASAADLLAREEQTGEAITLLERAIAIDPENTPYRRRLVILYAKAGQHERAQQLYAELQKAAAPAAQQEQMAWAWRFFQQGQVQKALEAVDKVFNKYGLVPQGYLLQAMAGIDSGNTKTLDETLQRYLEASGNSAEAHDGAGLCYLAIGDTSAAHRHFQIALDKEPANEQALVRQAVAEQLAQHIKEAEGLLDKARSASEKPALTDLLATNLALAKDDNNAYQTLLGKAASSFPGVEHLGPAVLNLAKTTRVSVAEKRNLLLLMYMNSWDSQAIRFADQDLQLFPTDPLALYFRGRALHAQGRLPEALQSLTAAREAAPEFLAVYLMLAVLHRQQNEQQAALADYQAALNLDKNFTPAYVGMAAVLMQLNRKPEMLTALQQAEKLARDGQTLFDLADLNERTGNKEKARELLNKALATSDKGQWRTQASSLRGRLESETGKSPKIPMH